MNKLLRDVDRWVCVALLILFFIYMISGYMITKGFINRFWGILLHTQLDLPIMAVFIAHFAIQFRFFLGRRIKDRVVINLAPFLVALFSFGFMVYLDWFFSL